MSTELNQPNGPEFPRRVAAAEQPRLGGVYGWTVLGTFVPGLGLWRAGRRVIGSVVMGFVLLLVGGLAGLAVFQRDALYSLATAEVLAWVAAGLGVLAVGWVILIGTTHLALRPAGATTGQRLAGGAVVAGLSFAVAAPLAFSANLAFTASTFIGDVLGGNEGSLTTPIITNAADPWAEIDRLNILIIGGDLGYGRNTKLGTRTDSVIVASVDTHTGATTLFSLPRQTAQMPFPKHSDLHKYFPNGWTDGNLDNQNYWLSAMYKLAPPRLPKDVLGKTKHLPEDILKLSVGEALGLRIDYFVLVNMDGFRDLITALGGITVNVNSPVPIGGKDYQRPGQVLPDGWIEPGAQQHVTGRIALWYARGRWGYQDYDRMARQRCVINAVAQQANPQNVLTNFEKLAAAGQKTVTTDLPPNMLHAMLTLAERVKGSKLRSIGFEHGVDGFSTRTPDWDLVRKRVQTALKETAKSNPSAPTNSAAPSDSPATLPATSPATVPTVTPSGTPSAASSAKPSSTAKTKPKSGDLNDACAYHPTGQAPIGYPNVRKP